MADEISARVDRLELPFDARGLDEYGVSKWHLRVAFRVLGLLYRNYFRAHAEGTARLFPVVREELPAHRCVYGVKSGYLGGEAPVLGLKVAGFWPANRGKGLPAHQALVVLTDPETGVPTAIMDANHITTCCSQ